MKETAYIPNSQLPQAEFKEIAQENYKLHIFKCGN